MNEENIDSKSVVSTSKTANIKMLDDEISIFINEKGQTTPLLIVARCSLDGLEYAAIFDTNTNKSFSVELVRVKGQIKYFKDLDGIGRDEEWAVVSDFFLDSNVFERNRIIYWIWNTRLHAQLGGSVPQQTMERWNKKKLKRRTK